MSRIERALEKATRLRGHGEEERIPSSQKLPAGPRSVTQENRPVRSRHHVHPTPFLVTLSDPSSVVTEEYRKLKSMIVKLTKQQRGFQNVLMVTSTVGNEGKTLTSLNLAITLSQSPDHSVLLVDADLRKPSVHRYLGLAPDVGMAECLSQDIEVADALVKTDIERLTVLPAGGPVANPMNLLASQKMGELMADIKHRYADRYVIVDTPPLLPFAETRALTAAIDGVVFVVREGAAPAESVAESLDILRDANVLGLVFNDASMEHVAKGYYGYYSYPQRRV